MTLALVAFTVVTLVADAIFVWQLKLAQKNLADSTRLFEGIVSRMADSEVTEREAHRKEVSDLLTRIQAPEAAPFVVGQNPGKQHIDAENDEEGWKAMRDQFENGASG